jgi:hypothetical protein
MKRRYLRKTYQGGILRVVGVVGQVQKLELEGSHLRQNGSSASPARRTTLSTKQQNEDAIPIKG